MPTWEHAAKASALAALLVLALAACTGVSNPTADKTSTTTTLPANTATTADATTTTADAVTTTVPTTPTTAAPTTTTDAATTAVPTTTTTAAPTTTTAAPPPPVANEVRHDRGDAYHPNVSLTPGAAFTGVTRQQVCTPGYSSSVRNVPQSEKDEVYAEYGITSHLPGAYEVDHLVSLELGGSNDISNLWPEPASGPDNSHSKDAVENRLHAEVCSGVVSLAAAQLDVVHWDRITVTGPSASAPSPTAAPQPPTSGGPGVYYQNCIAARAAGAAPISRGQPGYRPALDRDGDGIACE